MRCSRNNLRGREASLGAPSISNPNPISLQAGLGRPPRLIWGSASVSAGILGPTAVLVNSFLTVFLPVSANNVGLMFPPPVGSGYLIGGCSVSEWRVASITRHGHVLRLRRRLYARNGFWFRSAYVSNPEPVLESDGQRRRRVVAQTWTAGNVLTCGRDYV